MGPCQGRTGGDVADRQRQNELQELFRVLDGRLPLPDGTLPLTDSVKGHGSQVQGGCGCGLARSSGPRQTGAGVLFTLALAAILWWKRRARVEMSWRGSLFGGCLLALIAIIGGCPGKMPSAARDGQGDVKVSGADAAGSDLDGAGPPPMDGIQEAARDVEPNLERKEPVCGRAPEASRQRSRPYDGGLYSRRTVIPV